MMTLVGSRAMRHAFPGSREPRDWDVIARREELMALLDGGHGEIASLVPARPGKYLAQTEGGERVEIEEVEGCPSAGMLAALSGLPVTRTPLGEARVVPPAWLAGIKRAHVQWPIRWEKTIEDLHWLRERIGGDERRDPDIAEFVRIRRSEHAARHGERAARLAVSNEEFFARSQAAVGRVHEHDAIHEIVAYGPRPLYESFKRDLGRALLDRGMFEAADPLLRERLVREEAMAIALERIVIPRLATGEPFTPEAAYRSALQRVCTNLTSGWFRDWAIDHWPRVSTPDVDFVALYLASPLHRQVSENIVAPPSP